MAMTMKVKMNHMAMNIKCLRCQTWFVTHYVRVYKNHAEYDCEHCGAIHHEEYFPMRGVHLKPKPKPELPRAKVGEIVWEAVH